MRPRAWRWNSETASSCSNALTWRETADCDRPSCAPAWVKLPASAAAWKTLSLSQSMTDRIAIRDSLSCGMFRSNLFGCDAIHVARSEKAFRLERRHAAHAGGGDGLA